MTRSPYKLLDYYRYEDAGLFFGREEETRKMVGEILSSRLLVLFSPSGSGKTSLVNAGVRPQLEEMGYKTIYTRMEDEPIPSVCNAVSEKLGLPPCRDNGNLYEFLKEAVQKTGQPLVIFLDQFEEFFIVFRDQKKLRQEFVRQVARIKYDDRLPVFLVLSLREDYFANLHEFREAIPSIFQDNANIRLEPFTEKAARRAIEEPLKNKDIEEGQRRFEEKLVDAVIQDLKTDDGIEPIKLQLVCCTLWNQRPADSKQIPFSTYEAAGRAGKIFSNFIYERLNKIPRRKHKLMVRIFESLKTPDNTKRYRSYKDLQSQLNINKAKRLAALLRQLSESDIMRREERKGTHWYEFKHDYVVDEINRWIKERRERINRKRLLYGILPGVIIFIMLFTYAFIEHNTFYAEFSIPQYRSQAEEIILTRGFNPFNDLITTGYFMVKSPRDFRGETVKYYSDIKDYGAVKELRNKIKLSFWDKNNWKSLANTLRKDKSGEFLYKIGQRKFGIEKLIDALKDESPYVRGQAADTLVRLGKADKNVSDALLQALKDGYSSVRLQAAYTLVRLGKADKNVMDALLQALKDKNDWVRENAADTLVRLGKADKTVMDALLQALKDKVFIARLHAADILVRLGKADKNVIDALLQALKDESSDVRRNAAYTLGRLGKADKTVIDALLQALKDASPFVRQPAAASLGRLGKADKTVMDALLQALKDKYPAVWRNAADSLGRLGKADKNVIDALIKALKDKVFIARLHAADILVRLGKADKNVIDTLRQALKDENSAVRLQAADTLVRLGKVDKTVMDALLQALKDKSSGLRGQAADTLGRLEKADKTVMDVLLQALKDEDSDVRLQAADTLGRLGKADKSVIEALLQTLKDESSSVRLKAADSLVLLGKADKNVIDALLQALKDDFPYVRQQAAASMGRLGKADKNIIDALLQALKDKYLAVRRNAADSLGRLGKADKTVIDALLQALKDEDDDVREKAAASLGILWEEKSGPELLELLKHPLSGYRTAAAYALAKKKSISQEIIAEINRLKDKDERPWVRLGAWKAYELLQEKKEKEQEKESGE